MEQMRSLGRKLLALSDSFAGAALRRKRWSLLALSGARRFWTSLALYRDPRPAGGHNNCRTTGLAWLRSLQMPAPFLALGKTASRLRVVVAVVASPSPGPPPTSPSTVAEIAVTTITAPASLDGSPLHAVDAK